MKHRMPAVAAVLSVAVSVAALTPPETAYSHVRAEMCDTVAAIYADTLAATVTVEARAAVVNDREQTGESDSAWGLRWDDGLSVMLRSGNTAFGDAADERYARVTVSFGDSVISDRRFTSEFSMLSGQPNTLSVVRDSDGRVTVSGGRGRLVDVADFALPEKGSTGGVPSIVSCGKVRVTACVSEWEADRRAQLRTGWTVDGLRDRFERSGDPVEGFWVYFDRRNDADYARPGGRYVLAVVGEAGGYTLLYIDGAEVNRSEWEPCMRKGRLTPTVFAGQFDLDWNDAMMESMDGDMHAHVEQDALLVLEFPLLKSRMRFSKMPAERWGR